MESASHDGKNSCGNSRLDLSDAWQFCRFVEKFTPILRRHARRFGLQETDVDDLVQETLIKALRHLSTLPTDSNVEGWLITVQTNTFNDMLRTRKLRLRWVSLDEEENPELAEEELKLERCRRLGYSTNNVVEPITRFVRYATDLPASLVDLIAVGMETNWEYRLMAQRLNKTVKGVRASAAKLRARILDAHWLGDYLGTLRAYGLGLDRQLITLVAHGAELDVRSSRRTAVMRELSRLSDMHERRYLAEKDLLSGLPTMEGAMNCELAAGLHYTWALHTGAACEMEDALFVAVQFLDVARLELEQLIPGATPELHQHLKRMVGRMIVLTKLYHDIGGNLEDLYYGGDVPTKSGHWVKADGPTIHTLSGF